MITALDTNVLLDILIPNEQFYEASALALQQAADQGSLVVCDIVYAELCTTFKTERECNSFLDSTDIRVQPLTRESLFAASRAWRAYREQGGSRVRIMPDFLIGAHAQQQATRLVSRDRGFYRKLFPALDLRDPGIAAA